MKKILIFLGVASILFGILGVSAADVVDFESISDPFPGDCTAVEIPDPYEGFFWDGQWVEVTKDKTYTHIDCGHENSYGSPSGIHAAHNGWGKKKITITPDGFNFNFYGAYFTSWAKNDSYAKYSAKKIRVIGYLGGKKKYSKRMNLSPDKYDFLDVNFENIDKLEIVASGNDRYWLMDDFTYTIVP